MSRRTLILIATAILALALYTAGFKTGTFVLFGLAVLAELYFWFKLIGERKKDERDS